MEHNKTAKEIIKLIGGKDNIDNVYHCFTRIRFVLQDNDLAKIEKLENTDGIMAVQLKGGQLQIVIGNEVDKVFKEVEKLIENTQTSKNKSFEINTVFDFFSSVFMPLVPAIAGTGVLKGILMVINNYNLLDANTGLFQLLTVISDAVFYFLPFMIAYTAAKRIKTNIPLALTLAGVLMYPTIINGAKEGVIWNFLGLPLPLIQYSASVLPIIISVFVLKFFYDRIDKIIPKTLKVVVTPLIVLLIVVPLELIAIAPLGQYFGSYLGQFLQWIFNISPLIAGIIFTAFIPLIVLTGMHQALFPIFLQNISEYGYDYILPLFLVAAMAQAGGALGVYLKSKKKKNKAIAMSATISGLVGITEPALFGCLIKYKKALAAAMIGGGIGGGIAAAFNARAYAFSLPSIISLPTYFGPGLIYLIAGFSTSFIIPVIIIYSLGIDEEIDQKEKSENTTGTSSTVNFQKDDKNVIYSPLQGKTVKLQELDDKTFSQEIVGKGIAVQPESNKIFAPFSAKISMVFKTKHALSIESENGINLLIHMGINTVNLEGKPFTIHVKKDQFVEKGELIAEMNIKEIEENGYNPVTPIIVTNTEDYLDVITLKENKEDVNNNDALLAVIE